MKKTPAHRRLTGAGVGGQRNQGCGAQDCATSRKSDLSGVVLHHQQLIDFQSNPLAFTATGDLGTELGLVQFQVGRHVGQTGELQVAFSQLFAALALADGDHIAGLALVAGDVGDTAIHGHVAVVHQLTGAGHGGTEAEAETDIVETVLEQLEQVGSGGTLLGARFLHVTHELTLGDAVVEAKLLLLFETDRVFRALATGLAVLTGGIGPLCGLPGETGEVSQAPRDPQTRAAVSSHGWEGRGWSRAGLGHAGTGSVPGDAASARTSHCIGQPIGVRPRCDQRCAGLADAGWDRVLPAFHLTADRSPLSLHPHLQCLRPGGDPAARPLEGRLAHRETAAALPPLHPLRL